MTDTPRRTILITHATPEDNAFAMWLASRLISAGYDAWVDVKALRGGNDFWNVIDRKLRDETVKQIVCVSRHVTKDGVQKEIAVGNIVRKALSDPDFVIPIRVDATPFSEFPIEFVRQNAINAFPNWAECLAPLLETLRDANVPRITGEGTSLLPELVAAREDGRRTVLNEPENLITNWFPFSAMPSHLALVTGRGTNEQFTAWLGNHALPNAPLHRMTAILTDVDTFKDNHTEPAALETRYTIAFTDVVHGNDLGPFADVPSARRYVVNLLRQHWDRLCRTRGLLPFTYANGEIGWYFPDGLTEGLVKVTLPNGDKVARVFSGKFKDRRWHLCLLAKPRLFPSPVMRIHANLVLSEDGRTALPGDVTHKLRRRLTRSWWNDKWRDLLLGSVAWLAEGEGDINLGVGNEELRLASFPIVTNIDVSYAATETLPTEEGADGEIVTNAELDTPFDSDGEDRDIEEGAA